MLINQYFGSIFALNIINFRSNLIAKIDSAGRVLFVANGLKPIFSIFTVFPLFNLDKLIFSCSSASSAIEHITRKKSDLVAPKNVEKKTIF